ncbi:hypothetical protein SFRURICE_015780, partial [Spodoptera frugiperda]
MSTSHRMRIKLDGDVMNVCQQSVSRIIAQVSTLLANKMKDFVKFPSTESEISTVKQTFYEIAHFPGVIGCIDCTHIKIRSPGGLSSEPGGLAHESFIYNSSAIKQRLNTGILKGIILGDSGYAVSSVLLTPFLSPHTNPQENYNKSHIKTRNTVERCFGVWKKRFPCLQVGMGVKVETVVAMICACATLTFKMMMLLLQYPEKTPTAMVLQCDNRWWIDFVNNKIVAKDGLITKKNNY